MHTRSTPSSVSRPRWDVAISVLLLASFALAPAARGFEGWEHQDSGDAAAHFALTGLERLDPSLALPWKDRSGRILVSQTPIGPRVAAGQLYRGVAFGELVAMYADVVDQGAGHVQSAFDQLMGSTDQQLIGFETAIGRTFTGFFSTKDPALHGRGLELLAVNQTHFADDAFKAYVMWHQRALQLAATAGATGDLSQLWKALHLDALAQHSLTDLFATGHMVLDRDASLALQKGFDALNASHSNGAEGTLAFLRENIKSFIFNPTMFKLFWDKLRGGAMSIFTGLLHDSFNSNGAQVASYDVPAGWQAYGDSFYGKSPQNVLYARNAAYRSLRTLFDAYLAFRNRVDLKRFTEASNALLLDPTYFSALRLVPIRYQGAQRFLQPVGLGWMRLFAAAFNKFAGYGAESLGAAGLLPMAPKVSGLTPYKPLIDALLSSKTRLRGFYARGAEVAAQPGPDLSVQSVPYSALIVGLGVSAPFSSRKVLVRGVVDELYGSLARISYYSGGGNYARLDQLTPSGPATLPAPTAPNHTWKVGDKVSAPFRTDADMLNGVVTVVYGKLVGLRFVTGDTGWALGLRCHPAEPSSIPDEYQPRRLIKPLINKIDTAGQQLLGATGYAWLRDVVNRVGTKLADRAIALYNKTRDLFSDALHMTHSDCIERHVPDLAHRLSQGVVNETEIAAAEFWGRIQPQDLAASPDLHSAAESAWKQLMGDVTTLLTRVMDQGQKKVATWYPISKTHRAAAVLRFQQAYAADGVRVTALLTKYGQLLAQTAKR